MDQKAEKEFIAGSEVSEPDKIHLKQTQHSER